MEQNTSREDIKGRREKESIFLPMEAYGQIGSDGEKENELYQVPPGKAWQKPKSILFIGIWSLVNRLPGLNLGIRKDDNLGICPVW